MRGLTALNAALLIALLSTPGADLQAATKQNNARPVKAAPPPRAMPARLPAVRAPVPAVAPRPLPAPTVPRVAQPVAIAPRPAIPRPAPVPAPIARLAPISNPAVQVGHPPAVTQSVKAQPISPGTVAKLSSTGTSAGNHPAISPVAGLTPVKLGNGNTVYYNSAGHAFDSNGNPVSNTTVAGAKVGSPSIAPSGPRPAAGIQPTAQLATSAPQVTPRPAAAPVAGLKPVTLGNGQTVYYNSAGHAFDSQGNPVSNATIAGAKPAAVGTNQEAQVPAHSGVGSTSTGVSQPMNQTVPATLSAQDKLWADTLPSDLKARVYGLPAQTVAHMKEDGQWQTYQQSIQNSAASDQKVATAKQTSSAVSMPTKEPGSVAAIPQEEKPAPTSNNQEKPTIATAAGRPASGTAQTPVGLTQGDKRWADTLPTDLKQKVYALSATEVDDLKQTGHWRLFQSSITDQLNASGQQKATTAYVSGLTNPTMCTNTTTSVSSTLLKPTADGLKSGTCALLDSGKQVILGNVNIGETFLSNSDYSYQTNAQSDQSARDITNRGEQFARGMTESSLGIIELVNTPATFGAAYVQGAAKPEIDAAAGYAQNLASQALKSLPQQDQNEIKSIYQFGASVKSDPIVQDSIQTFQDAKDLDK